MQVAASEGILVLGPVEAVGPAGPAALTGARQRAVLGLLALHAGTVLPVFRLIDALWGDDPPRTAVKTLHSHVARIRSALAAAGLPGVLSTRDPGYLLVGVPSDVARFEELVATGRRALTGADAARAVTALRAAAGLWRGDAFADVPLTGWAAREVDRLHELRLAAAEDRWDAELRTGRHETAASELVRLLAANPANERLTRLHMLALYRSGRYTDALEAYQRLRRELADELGVDPGREVVELHTAMLRRDQALDEVPSPQAAGERPRPAVDLPPVAAGLPAAGVAAAVVPSQIPARVGHFTGRGDELAALDEVLAAADSDPEYADELPVVVISGPAGMGKTALAVQWAHRVADRFPGGRLFLDLRGDDGSRALGGAQALAHVLSGLGVPEERIPAGESERAALYRTLLHGRRCVIVLDNVGSVADVLPLVPGSGENLLVVTSRLSLAALAARHAMRAVSVDALGHAESVSLLTRMLGQRRVAAEPAAVAALARLCAGMPLALRIAGARLVGSPKRPIAEVVTELTGAARLAGFAVEGDSRTVQTVLTSAYRPLAAEQARLFRRVGIAPGPTFSAPLAAAVCDLRPADADAALATLAGANLVNPVGAGRFRFHDLIGEFAVGRLHAEEADPSEVVGRLLDWYTAVAHEANALVNPDRDVVEPVLRHPAPAMPFAAQAQSALAFLEAERDNLLPVVRLARSAGEHTTAWQLTYLLTSFYEATGHWHDRVNLCLEGSRAAAELGEAAAEAEMLRALGVAYFMTRQLPEAIEAGNRALAIVHAAGDLAGEGHVHNNLANAYAELRRFDEAVTAHENAVDRCARAGNRLGLALSQRNLGHTYMQMGAASRGLAALRSALEVFRDLGNGRLEAGTLDTIGEAHLAGGDTDAALVEFAAALRLSREIGDRWLEWEVLLHIGSTHLHRDAHAAALDHFTEALAVCRGVEDRHGEATVLNLLGRAHLLADQLDEAGAVLEQALAVRSLVPDGFEEAHLHRDLGDLARANGRPDAARAHWERATRLYQQANATAETAELMARLH